MSETNRRTGLPIAVIGAGNLGGAIARGIVHAGQRAPSEVLLTHLDPAQLSELKAAGHPVGKDNAAAIVGAGIVILSVQPRHVGPLLAELAGKWDPARHVLVSTALGVSIAEIRKFVGSDLPVVRAMPSIGIQALASMTCLAADAPSEAALDEVEPLFQAVGETIRIQEGQMAAATALCASGIAFFLRAIRAASEGGVQVGFHAEDAIRMAAQTAKGAAEVLLRNGTHPEEEIDQVTTPGGCTIAGLNEMERLGFSSAMAQGVIAATRAASKVHTPREDASAS